MLTIPAVGGIPYSSAVTKSSSRFTSYASSFTACLASSVAAAATSASVRWACAATCASRRARCQERNGVGGDPGSRETCASYYIHMARSSQTRQSLHEGCPHAAPFTARLCHARSRTAFSRVARLDEQRGSRAHLPPSYDHPQERELQGNGRRLT
jgi:hypothetical protein